MAKLIKKFASGKILSIEDFNFKLVNPIKQNKNFTNSDKSSQEFKNDDFKLSEFRSILLNDINTSNSNTSEEQKIEEDKGENSEILSFLKIPTQEVKKENKENNEIPSFLKIPQKNTKKYYIWKSSQPEGIKTFNEAFDKVQTRIPEIKKYRNFLTKLAERESSFRPDAAAKNTRGTALGYFQFMPFNRKNISPKDFVDNPELQIEMAWKLLKEFKNSFSPLDWNKARNKGYTESAMIAGAWLSGAGGVRNFLNTGYKAQDNLGTDVKHYMDKFNKLV